MTRALGDKRYGFQIFEGRFVRWMHSARSTSDRGDLAYTPLFDELREVVASPALGLGEREPNVEKKGVSHRMIYGSTAWAEESGGWSPST